MPHRELFDRIQARLARAGLPAGYIQRFTDELRDHFTDLEEERKSMSTEVLPDAAQERLGTVEELSDVAIYEYRQQSFFGRHPIISFIAAPIPVLIVNWALVLLAGIGLMELVPWLGGEAFRLEGKSAADWPPGAVALLQGFAMFLVYAPPVLTVVLFCWLARRGGRSWRWALASSILIALVAGGAAWQLDLPTEPGNGRLSAGVTLPWAWHQWIQVAVPLAIGVACILWSARRGQRTASIA